MALLPVSPLELRWSAFVDHCFAVAHEAGLPTQDLAAWVGPHGSRLPPDGGAVALLAFFATPAHRVGVETLNCSLFLTPVPFPGHPVPLGDIMNLFSGQGGARYGRVWTHLIDVAEAAGVEAVGPAREFIGQQMSLVTVGGGDRGSANQHGNAAANNNNPFEGILQSVVSAFPMLTDCMDTVIAPMMNQMMNAGAASADGGGGAAIQGKLVGDILKPILENMSQTLAAECSGEISGPMQQILGGFRGLSEIFANANGAPPDPPGAAGAGGDVAM